MQFSDETLMAYADGELGEAETARVKAALMDDKRLADRVERFRNVRRALQATYNSVAEEPIPERFRALLGDLATVEPETPKSDVKPAAPPAPQQTAPQQSAQVIDFAKARDRFLSPQVLGALAATLIVGVFAGRMVMPTNALLIAENGRVRAGAELTQVLDRRLASDDANSNTPLRVGLTFRARDGQYCRTFDAVAADRAVSGLACRASDAWVVQIAASETSARTDFRQAGSASPVVLERVDAIIDGETFDAATERTARDRGWRE